MPSPANKLRQQLLTVGALLLGVVFTGAFGWLAYGNVAKLLATQKLPPALLDKILFFLDGLKAYHWLLLFVGLCLLAYPLLRKKSAPAAGAGAMDEAARKAAVRKGPQRFTSCNVLDAGKDVRKLWHFSTSGDKVALQREESKLPNEPLPAKMVGKDWQTLFQPKLNVAWLPADQVFLRALQLPKTDDLAELQSMVELQLEKLSPMPVAQVVWTFEPMRTGGMGDLQTVIVLIVSRSLVEEFLGKLEGQGFLADRIELPLLDQIRATRIDSDGIWVYPGIGLDQTSCLVAWWYGETLHNLTLVRLPPTENRGPAFQEQLNQMAWAGELEGWLVTPPRVHLVADAETAAAWTPLFTPEQAVVVVPPLSWADLAGRTARRVATAKNGVAGLMLPEVVARYRQQFMDRLWMSGVGAVLLFYVFGVIVYFGLTEWAKWRLENLQSEVALKAPNYTNTLQLKAEVKVLQDQLDLRYAALDCYKAVADNLPEGVVLDTLNFERGSKLTLFGTAPEGDSAKVQEFNKALRKATVKEQPLFDKVQAPNSQQKPGGLIGWNFWCELKRKDAFE